MRTVLRRLTKELTVLRIGPAAVLMLAQAKALTVFNITRHLGAYGLLRNTENIRCIHQVMRLHAPQQWPTQSLHELDSTVFTSSQSNNDLTKAKELAALARPNLIVAQLLPTEPGQSGLGKDKSAANDTDA